MQHNEHAGDYHEHVNTYRRFIVAVRTVVFLHIVALTFLGFTLVAHKPWSGIIFSVLEIIIGVTLLRTSEEAKKAGHAIPAE